MGGHFFAGGTGLDLRKEFAGCRAWIACMLCRRYENGSTPITIVCRLSGSSRLCAGPDTVLIGSPPRNWNRVPTHRRRKISILLIGALTFNSGDLAFDPAGPIDNASADIGVGTVGYVRTLGLWGRLANVGFGLPYVRGNVKGDYLGDYHDVFRSGMGDPRLRFAINLYGGPALTLKEFMAYQQKWNLGVSLTVGVPLGQYDLEQTDQYR